MTRVYIGGELLASQGLILIDEFKRILSAPLSSLSAPGADSQRPQPGNLLVFPTTCYPLSGFLAPPLVYACPSRQKLLAPLTNSNALRVSLWHAAPYEALPLPQRPFCLTPPPSCLVERLAQPPLLLNSAANVADKNVNVASVIAASG